MAIVILWLRKIKSWLFLHIAQLKFLSPVLKSHYQVLYGHLKVSSLISLGGDFTIETLSTHCYQTHILPAGHSVPCLPSVTDRHSSS